MTQNLNRFEAQRISRDISQQKRQKVPVGLVVSLWSSAATYRAGIVQQTIPHSVKKMTRHKHRATTLSMGGKCIKISPPISRGYLFTELFELDHDLRMRISRECGMRQSTIKISDPKGYSLT